MSEFKDIIKGLRTEKDMTQNDLANALNLSKSTIAMWEIGKRLPSTEIYEVIADYFNVDMDFLYGKQPMKRKISIEDLDEHAELMASLTFNTEATPYLEMLLDLPDNYRELCYKTIKSFYEAYKNMKN